MYIGKDSEPVTCCQYARREAMIGVLICDDDLSFLEKMQAMVEKYFRSKNIKAKVYAYSDAEKISTQIYKCIDIALLDVDFESVLKRELGHSKYTSLDKKMRGLNDHLSDLTVSTYTDMSNYSYRLDRNNVDVDTENVELASEQIRYEAITSSINSQFQCMRTALGK